MARERDQRFDLDSLDAEDPFEIDDGNRPHLAKHPPFTEEDVLDAWFVGEPRFFPAKEPAHWLMVAHVPGVYVVVPLAPPRSGNPTKCRPIGIYMANPELASAYEETE